MKPIALLTVKTRLRKSASGRIGSAARRSTKHERDEQTTTPRHDERDHPGRAPRVGRAAEARVEHDRRQPAREQRRAEVVDRVLRVVGARVEGDGDHGERERRRAAG